MPFMDIRHLSATSVTLWSIVFAGPQDDVFGNICREPRIIKWISEEKELFKGAAEMYFCSECPLEPS